MIKDYFKLIKKLRLERDLAQAELAKKRGIGRSS